MHTASTPIKRQLLRKHGVPFLISLTLLVFMAQIVYRTRSLLKEAAPPSFSARESSVRFSSSSLPGLHSSADPSIRPVTHGFEGVLTYHADNARTGANPHETILSPANVDTEHFGKLFTVPVDGDVYAQPLYVPSVDLGSKGVRNVVYVATENNTIYAIDADDQKGIVLWSTHLGPALSFSDLGTCGAPLVGVTGTPVIDISTRTLYVVSRTFVDARRGFKLHAIDISSGRERPGSPVVVAAEVEAKGKGNRSGKLAFDPTLQLQRSGVALAHGKIYVGFGSSCDYGDYHGWLMAYDASTLHQSSVFVSTPNAARGGIWQSGAAPGIDAEGNVYIVTGDGTFNAASGGSDYGDSVLKLDLIRSAQGEVVDYFTPFDQERLDEINEDLGSSGAVLLPDQAGAHPHLLVSAGKNGTIYVVDRDNMGHFGLPDDAQIVQTVRNAQPKIDSTAAYWEGTSGRWIYISGVGGPLQQYSVDEGKLSARPVSQSEELFGYPGSTPSISANGKDNGIVWVVGTEEPDTRTVIGAYFHRIDVSSRSIYRKPGEFTRKVERRVKLLFHSPSIFWEFLKTLLPRRTPEARNRPAILRAYDANDVSNLLYDSSEGAQNKDEADIAVKFAVPTVANGKVYFGTQGYLDVYGLLNK